MLVQVADVRSKLLPAILGLVQQAERVSEDVVAGSVESGAVLNERRAVQRADDTVEPE